MQFTPVSVHILVNRCTQNVGSRTLPYLQELTNLIRNLILFDIAENMSQRNLNEFVWLILLFNICLNIPRDKIMIIHSLVVLILLVSLKKQKKTKKKTRCLKKHNRKTIQTRVMVPILRTMSKGRNQNVHVYITFLTEKYKNF